MYHYYPLAPKYCLFIIATCIMTLVLCHYRHTITAKGKRTFGGLSGTTAGIIISLLKLLIERTD